MLVALGALIAPPAEAQPVTQLDAGSFAIRSGERRIGTERFRIWRERGEVKAVGEVEVQEPAPWTVDVRLQADARFRPTRFGLRTLSGGSSSVDAAWNGDRLRLHLTSDEGERWKELLTPGAVAVLEAGVSHHFFLVFQQLGAAGTGSQLEIVVPSRGEQATATIGDRRSDQLTIGERVVACTRYELTVGAMSYEVWIDDEGRVQQVRYADGGRLATRLPEEP